MSICRRLRDWLLRYPRALRATLRAPSHSADPEHRISRAFHETKKSQEMEFNTFHPFRRLPAELRCMIWSFTTPAPRVLEIVWSDRGWESVSASRVKPNYAMQANKEAYDNFLLSWTPFCKHQAADEASPADYPISYINPEIDTIYIGAVSLTDNSFSTEALEQLQALPCISQLRFLGIEISEWHEQEIDFNNRGTNWEIDFLISFPKLELLTIVDYDIDWNWISRGKMRPVGEITFVEPTQIDWKNDLEMWPHMEKRLNELRKLPDGKNLPKAQVKEVLRGSERMTFM